MALVNKVLGGRPFGKVLVSTTDEGIEIGPLYTRDTDGDEDAGGLPGASTHRRGARASGDGDRWDIRQRHDLVDVAATNQAILDDLEQGATSLLLRSFGPLDASLLDRVLDGVYLDMAGIALDAGPWQFDAAEALVERWSSIGADARIGSLRLDPIGALARHGALPLGLDDALARTVDFAGQMAPAPHATAVAVDATVYADAGGSDADEIAAALATGVAYLRAFEAHGIAVDDAAKAMEFTFAATADQFATIAKLRAARVCWSRVIEASGGTVAGQRQHVITAPTMFSRVDPWVNLLRAATACFAGAAGGAAAITVLPFDAALGQTVELGRRTARNIQLVLQEESHIGQVIDPAGGSWFVERFTTELAERSWSRFQAIEAAGGIVEALRGGTVRADLDTTWQARRTGIATRRRAITGVSEFPAFEADPLARLAHPEMVLPPEPGETIEPLPVRRPAEDFEALRAAADAASSEPTVFLASMGGPAVHTARSTFAANFFAAGGIKAQTSDGYEDAAAVAAAFTASGARLAVICSSDDRYVLDAADVAAALKGAGAARVYLAGHPGDRRTSDEAAGVDEFIHLGCDIVESLRRAHDVLEISQ